MNLSDAFTETPPKVTIRGKEIQLRPFAPLSHRRVMRAGELSKEFGDTAICLGYVLTHSLPPDVAARITRDDEEYSEAIDAIAMDISLEDLQNVAAYLSRVFERVQAAQVETPEPQGKA